MIGFQAVILPSDAADYLRYSWPPRGACHFWRLLRVERRRRTPQPTRSFAIACLEFLPKSPDSRDASCSPDPKYPAAAVPVQFH